MSLAARYKNLEDPLRTERRIELVLLIIALLLVLQLLWSGFRALVPTLPEPVQPQPDALELSQFEPGAQLDPDMRAQIAARPLFWSTRRPAAAAAAAAAEAAAAEARASAAQPGKIEGVQLTGVFGGGESAGVIVIAKGKKRRLSVGEQVSGWTLQSVQAAGAVFVSKGQQAELALRRAVVKAAATGDMDDEEAVASPKQGKKAAEQPPAPAPGTRGDSLSLGGRVSDK